MTGMRCTLSRESPPSTKNSSSGSCAFSLFDCKQESSRGVLHTIAMGHIHDTFMFMLPGYWAALFVICVVLARAVGSWAGRGSGKLGAGSWELTRLWSLVVGVGVGVGVGVVVIATLIATEPPWAARKSVFCVLLLCALCSAVCCVPI
jgi:hypothetical protein